MDWDSENTSECLDGILMQKSKINIPGVNGKWGSYISKYPSDSGIIPVNAFTKDTRNLVTAISGQAQKIQGGTLWNPLSSLGAAPLDQYEGIFNSGTRLLIYNVAGTLKGSSGNNLFSVIQGGFNPLANFEFSSYQDRIYGDNGIDSPIVIDTATSYGGVSYSFTLAKTKAMGAQPPVSAPTVVLVVDAVTPQVPAGAHTYKITFVYYNGQEESNGGPASAPVTNDASHTSNNLSAIPIGGYGVSARNIYRDNNDGNWLLLDTIPNNTTTTYHDILPIGSTPTPIPDENGLPPIFKYIANWLDRNFVAGVEGAPNSLYWSAAGQPDIFFPGNVIFCRNDDIITALFVFGGLLYVFGQHSVGVILGNTDNTFYYSPISTTTGCVDNRSIAVRTLVSVPTMIWLSALPNKGFYYSQGSAVQYMSDFIDDLALNISQIAFLERSNTQASQTAFEGDTSTPGIDLTTNPGAIQTINPKAFYGSAAEWLTGTIVNLGLIGDQLKNMIQFAPAFTDGSFGGDAQVDGLNLDLPTSPAFTGENFGSGGQVNPTPNAAVGGFPGMDPHFGLVGNIYQKFTPTKTGTLLTLQMPAVSLTYSSHTFDPLVHIVIRNDNSGLPGSTVLFDFTYHLSTTGNTLIFNGGGFLIFLTTVQTPGALSIGVSLVGGTSYWIGYENVDNGDNLAQIGMNSVHAGTASRAVRVSGYFTQTATQPCTNMTSFAASYTYTSSVVADAGNWMSPVYDTLSNYNNGTGMTFVTTGSYPTGCTASVVIQGSNSNTGPWTTTDTLSNPTGITSLTGGAFRYWQCIITLNTADNTVTPSLTPIMLTFSTVGTWSSPAILTTSDITALVALVAAVSSVAGTSFTILIRTAASSGTLPAATYTTIGLATPNNYAQVKLTMNTDAGDTITAAASTVEFDWSIQSTIESTPIDTGANPPAGWGPFQFDSVGAGTTTVYFRTAATSGGLSSATYTAIANGIIPTNTVFEWAQWKIIFTATADSFPQVNSVTVNWFVGTTGVPARCASVFFNKSYYCSVAIKGQTANNLLIEFDYEGNWRIHGAFNIATLGTYFNDLYYGSSISGDVLNAFKQNTENGSNIILDLRTKCFDYADKLHLKTVRSLQVTGVGTNTLLHAYYSLDRGTTWIEMLNSSGILGFQTPNDGMEFTEYFIPNFDGSAQTGGRTIIYRLVSADQYPCTILEMAPTAYVRQGKALREIIGF